MKPSTKHAIAQRILALVGFAFFITPIWFKEFISFPKVFLFLGLFVLSFCVFSALGFGPWGRYYSALVVSENESFLKLLEPNQPWQN